MCSESGGTQADDGPLAADEVRKSLRSSPRSRLKTRSERPGSRAGFAIWLIARRPASELSMAAMKASYRSLAARRCSRRSAKLSRRLRRAASLKVLPPSRCFTQRWYL